MPPLMPPFMAPFMPPAPPPVPVMSPLARISLPPKKPPWPPPATPPEGIWRFWTAPPAAPDSGSPTSPPPAVNAISAVGAKKMTVNPRISLRMALLRIGNTWQIPNRDVGSQPSRTQEHATHVKRGTRNDLRSAVSRLRQIPPSLKAQGAMQEQDSFLLGTPWMSPEHRRKPCRSF